MSRPMFSAHFDLYINVTLRGVNLGCHCVSRRPNSFAWAQVGWTPREWMTSLAPIYVYVDNGYYWGLLQKVPGLEHTDGLFEALAAAGPGPFWSYTDFYKPGIFCVAITINIVIADGLNLWTFCCKKCDVDLRVNIVGRRSVREDVSKDFRFLPSRFFFLKRNKAAYVEPNGYIGAHRVRLNMLWVTN